MRRRIVALAAALITLGISAAIVQGNTAYDPVSGAPVLQAVMAPISTAASRQLQALGPGTQVVECAPGLAQLQAGITPSRPLGFMQSHPGFTVLADGHCAMDKAITPSRVVPDNADVP
jgi:hypothetical protein